MHHFCCWFRYKHLSILVDHIMDLQWVVWIWPYKPSQLFLCGSYSNVPFWVLGGFKEFSISDMVLRRHYACGYVEYKADVQSMSCNREGPRFMPNLEQGDHFGLVLPPLRSFWRANTGHQKWFSFIFVFPLIPAKSSNLEQPSFWEGTMLWM